MRCGADAVQQCRQRLAVGVGEFLEEVLKQQRRAAHDLSAAATCHRAELKKHAPPVRRIMAAHDPPACLKVLHEGRQRAGGQREGVAGVGVPAGSVAGHVAKDPKMAQAESLLLEAAGLVDVLQRHHPLLILESHRREYESLGYPFEADLLANAIDDGTIKVKSPGLGALPDHLRARHYELSVPDAEGLAWALKEGYFLLAEDGPIIAVGESEGVDMVDLCDVLKAIRSSGLLDDKELVSLVYLIDLDLGHGIADDCKRALGAL